MSQNVAAAKPRRTGFRFLGEIINELKKVVWLSRREAIYLTVLVLVITVIAGVFLGLLDFGFAALVGKVFLGR